MDKISQNEINALLDALSNGEVKMNELQKSQEPLGYGLYDFRRPDKFTKEQLRTLEVLQLVTCAIMFKLSLLPLFN
jgi:flagellar motor switch protein FliM